MLEDPELLFLIWRTLSAGPLSGAARLLEEEASQHGLLPTRVDIAGHVHPVAFAQHSKAQPHIPPDALRSLLRRLLQANNSSDAAGGAQVLSLTAPGKHGLLGQEEPDLPRWRRKPHVQAGLPHQLLLRDTGVGRGRLGMPRSLPGPGHAAATGLLCRQMRHLTTARGHRLAVYCCTYDNTGRRVVTGSDDCLVKIWSAETGLLLKCCRGHDQEITDFAVSCDNQLLASGDVAGSIRVWSLKDDTLGWPVAVLSGHTNSVASLDFHPHLPDALLSSATDGTCRIWHARDPGVAAVVMRPGEAFGGEGGSDADGEVEGQDGPPPHGGSTPLIITAGAEPATATNGPLTPGTTTPAAADATAAAAAAAVPTSTADAPTLPSGGAFSPPSASQQAAAGATTTTTRERSVGPPAGSGGTQPAGTQPTTTAVGAGGGGAAGAGAAAHPTQGPPNQHVQFICCSWSPDGDFVFAGGSDCTVCVWHWDLTPPPPPAPSLGPLSLGPSLGPALQQQQPGQGQEAAAAQQPAAPSGDPSSGAKAASAPQEEPAAGGVSTVPAAEDSSREGAGASAPSGAAASGLAPGVGSGMSSGSSPLTRGHAGLIGGSRGRAEEALAAVWEAREWPQPKELAKLCGHRNDIVFIEFSHEGHSVATASRDGCVKIWRRQHDRRRGRLGRSWREAMSLACPPTEEEIRKARLKRKPPPHPAINQVAWNLDDTRMVAAVTDNSVRVWNTQTGVPTHTLLQHTAQAHVLEAHPHDPRLVMSGGYDGRTILWDVVAGTVLQMFSTQDTFPGRGRWTDPLQLLDGHFSPTGAQLAVTDAAGQLHLYGVPSSAVVEAMVRAPYDQFLSSDYNGLVRDVNGWVLDELTQRPPHLLAAQVLCDFTLHPHAVEVQAAYVARRMTELPRPHPADRKHPLPPALVTHPPTLVAAAWRPGDAGVHSSAAAIQAAMSRAYERHMRAMDALARPEEPHRGRRASAAAAAAAPASGNGNSNSNVPRGMYLVVDDPTAPPPVLLPYRRGYGRDSDASESSTSSDGDDDDVRDADVDMNLDVISISDDEDEGTSSDGGSLVPEVDEDDDEEEYGGEGEGGRRRGGGSPAVRRNGGGAAGRRVRGGGLRRLRRGGGGEGESGASAGGGGGGRGAGGAGGGSGGGGEEGPVLRRSSRRERGGSGSVGPEVTAAEQERQERVRRSARISGHKRRYGDGDDGPESVDTDDELYDDRLDELEDAESAEEEEEEEEEEEVDDESDEDAAARKRQQRAAARRQQQLQVQRERREAQRQQRERRNQQRRQARQEERRRRELLQQQQQQHLQHPHQQQAHHPARRRGIAAAQGQQPGGVEDAVIGPPGPAARPSFIAAGRPGGGFAAREVGVQQWEPEEEEEEEVTAPLQQVARKRSHDAGGSRPRPLEAYAWLQCTSYVPDYYCPQLGDEVVYVRALHEAYLDSVGDKRASRPWVALPGLRPCEPCMVTELGYEILRDGVYRTAANLRLTVDAATDSPAAGSSFTLQLPPPCPDQREFLVPLPLFRQSVAKAWRIGEECKFYQVIDGEGSWQPSRVVEDRLHPGLGLGGAPPPPPPLRQAYACELLWERYGVSWGEETVYFSPWALLPLADSWDKVVRYAIACAAAKTDEIIATANTAAAGPSTSTAAAGSSSGSAPQLSLSGPLGDLGGGWADEQATPARLALERLMSDPWQRYDFFISCPEPNAMYPCADGEGRLVPYNVLVPLPISLEVVEGRLQNSFYRSLPAVRHDINLIVSNAERFNGFDSPVARRARDMRLHFTASLAGLSPDMYLILGPDVAVRRRSRRTATSTATPLQRRPRRDLSRLWELVALLDQGPAAEQPGGGGDGEAAGGPSGAEGDVAGPSAQRVRAGGLRDGGPGAIRGGAECAGGYTGPRRRGGPMPQPPPPLAMQGASQASGLEEGIRDLEAGGFGVPLEHSASPATDRRTGRNPVQRATGSAAAAVHMVATSPLATRQRVRHPAAAPPPPPLSQSLSPVFPDGRPRREASRPQNFRAMLRGGGDSGSDEDEDSAEGDGDDDDSEAVDSEAGRDDSASDSDGRGHRRRRGQRQSQSQRQRGGRRGAQQQQPLRRSARARQRTTYGSDWEDEPEEDGDSGSDEGSDGGGGRGGGGRGGTARPVPTRASARRRQQPATEGVSVAVQPLTAEMLADLEHRHPGLPQLFPQQLPQFGAPVDIAVARGGEADDRQPAAADVLPFGLAAAAAASAPASATDGAAAGPAAAPDNNRAGGRLKIRLRGPDNGGAAGQVQTRHPPALPLPPLGTLPFRPAAQPSGTVPFPPHLQPPNMATAQAPPTVVPQPLFGNTAGQQQPVVLPFGAFPAPPWQPLAGAPHGQLMMFSGGSQGGGAAAATASAAVGDGGDSQPPSGGGGGGRYGLRRQAGRVAAAEAAAAAASAGGGRSRRAAAVAGVKALTAAAARAAAAEDSDEEEEEEEEEQDDETYHGNGGIGGRYDRHPSHRPRSGGRRTDGAAAAMRNATAARAAAPLAPGQLYGGPVGPFGLDGTFMGPPPGAVVLPLPADNDPSLSSLVAPWPGFFAGAYGAGPAGSQLLPPPPGYPAAGQYADGAQLPYTLPGDDGGAAAAAAGPWPGYGMGLGPFAGLPGTVMPLLGGMAGAEQAETGPGGMEGSWQGDAQEHQQQVQPQAGLDAATGAAFYWAPRQPQGAE